MVHLPRYFRGKCHFLMEKISSPQNTDNAHRDPEGIEQGIGFVSFQDGAPGQQDGIDGIEKPDKEKGAFGPHPAHQPETENSHQYARHFERWQVFEYECVEINHRNHEVFARLEPVEILRDNRAKILYAQPPKGDFLHLSK